MDDALPLEAVVARPSRDERFSAFFEVTYAGLAGYCLGLTGEAELAADTAQEALARLYARWTRVDHPKAWCYLVATNLLRDAWSARARERDAVLRLARGAVDATGPDLALRDLVERLPERYRTAVLLHYYADLPVEQVAAVLRRPVGTVKRRLHEARQLLGEGWRRG